MQYLELSISVRPEAVEPAADLLREYAPSGVAIEAAVSALDEDGAVSLDEDALVRLRAWLPADSARARDTLRRLRGGLRSLDGAATTLRTRRVGDGSWADAWKRYFPVLRIGRRLVIKPSWRRYRARAGELVIELDPGMAFGTGQHPTTRMCLEALEERVPTGACVLDVGCGSGILSIAAAKLGAQEVDALDVEAEAVRATAENAERNRVDVRAATGSFGDEWPFPERAAGRYDVVLANLSSRLALGLASPLVAAVRPTGVAIVSGVTEEHEAACGRALEEAGAAIIETRSDGAWRLLLVERH